MDVTRPATAFMRLVAARFERFGVAKGGHRADAPREPDPDLEPDGRTVPNLADIYDLADLWARLYVELHATVAPSDPALPRCAGGVEAAVRLLSDEERLTLLKEISSDVIRDGGDGDRRLALLDALLELSAHLGIDDDEVARCAAVTVPEPAHDSDWTEALRNRLMSAAVFGIAGFMAAPFIGGAVGSVAGLTGAAATAHGLAVLGGGALASGGAGMVGGTWVVAAAAAFLGTAGTRGRAVR